MLEAAVISAMLAWASQLSGLPMPPDGSLPSTEWAAPKELSKDTIAATYMSDGHVVINPNYDFEGHGPFEFTCTLVHEYTHYLQWYNGWAYDPYKMEPPAYEAGSRCFAAYGDELSAARDHWHSLWCKKHRC